MAATRKIIIQNASLKGQPVDLHITGNRISRISPHQSTPSPCSDGPDTVYIDAQQMNVFPAFYNTHNHAAMTLLRGYADDLPLKTSISPFGVYVKITYNEVKIEMNTKRITVVNIYFCFLVKGGSCLS